MKKKKKKDSANDEKTKKFDYVIVGGGIAGLYCAKELLERYPGSKIAIFEKSNRLGGKIETFRFDPERYRYNPDRHNPERNNSDPDEPGSVDEKTLRRDERAILDTMRILDKKISDFKIVENAQNATKADSNGTDSSHNADCNEASKEGGLNREVSSKELLKEKKDSKEENSKEENSKEENSKAENSKAENSKAENSKAENSKAENSKVEDCLAQPRHGRRLQWPIDKILNEQELLIHQRMLKTVLIAELGPMRIEPEHQPILSGLLSELGFKQEDPSSPTWSDLVPFSPFSGEPPSGLDFPLEGEEAEQESLLDLLLLAFRRIFENIDKCTEKDKADYKGNPSPKDLNDGTELDQAIVHLWNDFTDSNYVHRQHWKRNIRNWINCLHDGHYRYIRAAFSYKGTLLRKMGFWNLIASVLSHMATVKLRDWGSFYHLIGDNPNAAEWLIFWLRALRTTDSLVSVRGGMDLIVEKLCVEILGVHSSKWSKKEGLKPKVTVFFEHQLMKVKESGNSEYPVSLSFLGHKEDPEEKDASKADAPKADDPNADDPRADEPRADEPKADDPKADDPEEVTTFAKHVILALPQGPLKRLGFDGVPYGNIRTFDGVLDSVKPIPLLKCFVLFDRPFWENDRPANRFAHTVPTREIHYWKNATGTAGLVMLYTDNPGHEYWSNYISHESMPLRIGQESMEIPSRVQKKADIHTWEPDEAPFKKALESKWEAGQLEWEHSQLAMLKFGNKRLLRTFLAYAREGSAATTPESSVLAAAIRDWSLQPAEGATHYWRPGINSEDIMNYLSGFSLLNGGGGTSGPLHVCGEAYSDYHGFIEGALRSVLRVINRLPAPDSRYPSDGQKSDHGSAETTSEAKGPERPGIDPRPIKVTAP